nr:hypothetical protein [Sodalinema gerasimenkoae]
MNINTCSVSTCRSCRYYTPEGRRGGQCQQLGAPVCGSWKSCSLAFPPFAPSWEHLEKLISLDSREPVSHRNLQNQPVPTQAERVAV